MELKVWVEGVVRVVCGLSHDTSCQDVVIALAQSIGQTGRYVLILKVRGTERQLAADACPLQHLAQLGQLAAEVQLVLRRTGPSLGDGRDKHARGRRFPQPGPPEPETLKLPHKALTFSLGPLTHPKRTKPNRAWSPSPRASPEPRASPVSFLDSLASSKDEVFRRILQQQRRLQDLEVQLQALERETEGWERSSSASGPGPTRVSEVELEELERRWRQNEAELMQREKREDQFQAETDRERDMQRRLRQLVSSTEDCDCRIEELRVRSAHLDQDVQLGVRRRGPRQQEEQEEEQQEEEEALGPLKEELQLQAACSDTQSDLQTAEETLQGRRETFETLSKELRQCKLQQFIQQTGGPQADQINPPLAQVYLSNAGIVE